MLCLLKLNNVTSQTKSFAAPVCDSLIEILSARVLHTTDVASNQTPDDVLPISKMPGPKTYPLIGSMIAMSRHKEFDRKKIHNVFLDYVKQYGPIFRFKFPGLPTAVLITQPDDVEKFYKITLKQPVRISFQSLKKAREKTANNYFEHGTGLLTENYEKWWRVRSRVQTPMLKPKNLYKYIPQMDEVTLEFMDIIAQYQKELGEMPENFVEEMYKWALESVSLVALSKRLGCLQPNLPEDSMQMQLIKNVNNIFATINTLELSSRIWTLFPTTTFRKLQRSHDLFLKIADEGIEDTVRELAAKRSKGADMELTLMEILLSTDGLTRKDVVTMILDMLFAGIDTTSHTIAFALYLLARNPDAQRRLHEEVDSVLGDGKGHITETHLARLTFLKACVKESLRIFPLVFGNGRLLTEDAILGGYLIPKGYQVITFNHSVAKDESLFSRAKEFLPDRWARDKPLGHIHPFSSLPFSHGPRMCIGRRIAEQEIYIFLARAMHRFEVDYKYDDMDIIRKLISCPSEPLRFQFKERRMKS